LQQIIIDTYHQNYVRVGGNWKLMDNVDEATSMNLIWTNNLIPFDKDIIKPWNCLQPKFMAILATSNLGQGKDFAYKMYSRRKHNMCSLELFKNTLVV
jgi:hypothetical protein